MFYLYTPNFAWYEVNVRDDEHTVTFPCERHGPFKTEAEAEAYHLKLNNGHHSLLPTIVSVEG